MDIDKKEFLDIKFCKMDDGEKETTINFYYGESFFTLYTSDNKMFNKYKKVFYSVIESGEGELLHLDDWGIKIRLPIECLSIVSSVKKKRTISEEESAARKERIAEARKHKS